MPIDPRLPADLRVYPSAMELARAIVAACRGLTIGELRQAEREAQALPPAGKEGRE